MKKVPINDPYSSDYAAELDGMTVEMMIKKHMSNEAGHQVIEAACKVAFG